MNKYLFDTYKKKSVTERSEFAFRFRNSPTAIKFIRFLDQTIHSNFKSAAAIDTIYADDVKSVRYSVLENRYFKLRKKLLDELENFGKNDGNIFHTEQELKFYKAK